MTDSAAVRSRPSRESEPEYRVRLVRSQLHALDDFDRDSAARVRAKLPPAYLQAIESSPKTAWLPAPVNIAVITCAYEELGRRRYVEFYQSFAAKISTTPLFDALARGILSIFVLSPKGVLKSIPRAYSLAARGWGEMKIVFDDARPRAQVRLEKIPAQLRCKPYVYAWVGSFRGAVDLTQRTADVVVHCTELERGVVAFDVVWTE